MIFGPVPVAEAVGAVLAYAVPLPGGRLPKGARLSPADVARLQAAGVPRVTVARLAPDDVPEDVAAARIAEALVAGGSGPGGSGPVGSGGGGSGQVESGQVGLRLGAAATGRVNIHAQAPGVLALDTAAIAALNAVDPMITLATLAAWHRLEPGGMAATVKIISYGVPEAAVAQACAVARGAMALRPVALRTACLIETEVPGKTHGPKGRAATKARLDRLGMTLAPRLMVPHETAPLAAAIEAAVAGPVAGAGGGGAGPVAVAGADLVLILTASATSDPMDVAPAALVAAGGRVERFGMPVDPGNLLFLGDLRGVPVIGLPGCARSPALNGADWVLERVACGIPLTAADIAAMGVGGLLKEIPSRPTPREG